MPRKPRSLLTGLLHHVTFRGNDGRRIANDDIDYRLLVGLIRSVQADFEWDVHSYCVMPNHVHLLVAARQVALSAGMRVLVGVHAREFNTRYDLTEHLFGQRFFAAPVERDSHAIAVCRYIVVNPVRARLAESAEQWAYSSYRVVAGIDPPDGLVTRNWTDVLFGSSGLDFETYVRADPRSPGSARPDLADFLGDEISLDEIATVQLYGYNLSEVGQFYGVSGRTMNRRLQALRAERTAAE